MENYIKIDINKTSRIVNRKNPIAGIYMIRHKEKIYIGQSSDVENRFSQYYKKAKCKGQKLLYRCLNKYGVENHDFIVIHRVDIGVLDKHELREILNKLESHYINKLKSFVDDNPENGLNLTKGGDCPVMSNETIFKISESHKGMTHTEETKQKMREIKIGTKASPETKMKLSQMKMGEKNHMYGKVVSEASKLKNSISNTGKKQSDETRKKQSLAAIGKKKKNETKIKIGNYHRGKIVSDETKKKQSEAKLGKKLTPEFILKRNTTRKRNKELIEEEKRMMIF